MQDDSKQYWITKKNKLSGVEIYSKQFLTLNSAWDFWDDETENLDSNYSLAFLEIHSGGIAKVLVRKN